MTTGTSDAGRSEPSVGRGAGLAFALALAITVLMAAPVIRAPTERIFGDGSILSQSDPNRDPLVVIGQFQTGVVPPPYLQPLTDLPGRFLALWIGPVAAYNFVVLVTFPLAAAFAYLLGRYVLGSHRGALIAGLVYAFLPFHVMQAGGHPHAAQTQWLPLFLLALWRCVDQPGFGRALLVLAAAAVAALADFYSGFMIAVIGPLAVIVHGASRGASIPRRWRDTALTLLLFLSVIAIGYAVVRAAFPAVISNPGSLAMSRSDLFVWSAKWWSYLLPPADHPLLGARVRELWTAHGLSADRLEHQQVSLGLSLLALATIPLWRFGRGERDVAAVRRAPGLAVLAGAALLCSLSPERMIGSFEFVRPAALLFEWAPMFRAYARFGVIVGLMTALLAGAGAVWLWNAGGRRARFAVTLLLTLTVFEYASFPPWRSRDILPTPAHRLLAEEPGPARVLDCVRPGRFSDTLAAAHLPHPISWLGHSGVDDCGEPRLGEKLVAIGFTHVIARKNTAITTLEGLTLESEPGDARIFRVTAEKPRAHLALWLGFHARETEGTRSWRFMEREGTLRFSIADAFEGAMLDLELRSFPAGRRVEWLVAGRAAGAIELSPRWGLHTLSLGPLSAREVDVTLRCREPGVVANDVLGNGDERTLCLAVSTWNLRPKPGRP